MLIACLAWCLSLGSPLRAADVVEPRVITAVGDLRAGEGAVLLSIRHQAPVSQTMHIYFSSADDPAKRIKFERKVGLGGLRRMLGRVVNVYAVPAGRWILVSHMAGCDGDLKAGEACVQRFGSASYPLPSGTYEPGWMVLNVREHGMTDADELILESPMPESLKLVAMPSLAEIISWLKFKHRIIPAADKSAQAAFQSLDRGSIEVATEAASNIKCERPYTETKGQFIPFAC